MEIKLNSSKLNFKVSPKTILQTLFDFSFGSAITEIINWEANIETKAFQLLYNVTKKTNFDLSKALGQEQIDKAGNLLDLAASLESEWTAYFEQNITITREFFENIIQYNPSYLTKSYRLFEKYLQLLDIGIPDHFYYSYYETFRANLAEEFQNGLDKYRELLDFFDNPVSTENNKLTQQLSHYIGIKDLYTTPLQIDTVGATETLRDLYIEPYFKIHRQNSISKPDKKEEFVATETVISIHSFLNDYFLKETQYPNCRENYNMIFVVGQPGQGKTSFCYRLVYDILESTNGLPDTPLYFIKIRSLHAKDFINDTFATINTAINQNIDFKKDKSLLILDGLDEAYMSGGFTDTDIKHLYERLNKSSQQNPNLKIILTSRLNYLKVNDPSLEGSLVLKLEELTDAQIKSYVTQFKFFYPSNQLVQRIQAILSTNSFKPLRELIRQPVLLYFIALSNVNINADDSIAEVYNKIFEQLAKRSWDKNGQLSYIKPELKENPKKYSKYLRKFIRSIANKIYQSPHLHISVKQLEELEATNQFIRECFNDNFSKNIDTIKEISKYLLISFYFQQSNKNQEEDTAIEFFHNSLWEYLTAEYMWEEHKRITLNTDEDNDLKIINLEEYFTGLQKLVGNKELDSEIVYNLEKIISNESNATKKKIISQTKHLFYKLIEKGILLTFDWKNEELRAKEKSSNIFELAWTFYHFSNLEIDNTTVTNTELNHYYFQPSSKLNYNYTLKDVRFLGEVYQCDFTRCVLFNVRFYFKQVTNFYLYENSFFNCNFKGFLIYGNIIHNTFNDVTFEDLFWDNANTFTNNELINCKFINVRVVSEYSLNKIITENSVDSSFIKHHKIIKITENEHSAHYYIDYIELPEEE